MKPDVVARGVGVLSSVPTDSYAFSQGTSMSSPAVTGIAALMVEQWRKTFGGATPTPAQLKGAIIAGADDLGNPGPDYTYGFGLVNAKSSADIIIADEGTGKRIRNLTFASGQGGTQEVALAVPTAQKLRVVLNWADPAIPFPPGTVDDIAPKALINDLDVKVIDPSGNTHLAYVLDKENLQSNATRGVNTISLHQRATATGSATSRGCTSSFATGWLLVRCATLKSSVVRSRSAAASCSCPSFMM